MATVDDLPADQRAALQLLLKQGRSYDEIAQLLRIEPRAVRERARAALDALGPEDPQDLDLERQDDIADYLLGQQTASQREATRAFLEGSEPGREWARTVRGALREGGFGSGDDLPDVPVEAAESDEAFGALHARRRRREQEQRSSRAGGVVLLGALAVLLAGVLVFALTRGDGGEGSASTGTTTPPTTTGAAAPPQPLGQVRLTGQSGSEARGAALLVRQGRTNALLLQAEDLPEPRGFNYGIWVRTRNGQAQPAGFADAEGVSNGTLQAQQPLQFELAGAREVFVTREPDNDITPPGPIVLRGSVEPVPPQAAQGPGQGQQGQGQGQQGQGQGQQGQNGQPSAP